MSSVFGTTPAKLSNLPVSAISRAARMVAQKAIDPTLPGLEDVIKALRAATFMAPAATPYEQEIRRATSRVNARRPLFDIW